MDLLEENMNIQEIMEIDIDNLAEKQHNAVKNHVIEVLQDIINLVEEEKYEEIQNKLIYSPSGDGYGEDNHYINFSYRNGEEDIKEMMDRLKNLKSKCK